SPNVSSIDSWISFWNPTNISLVTRLLSVMSCNTSSFLLLIWLIALVVAVLSSLNISVLLSSTAKLLLVILLSNSAIVLAFKSLISCVVVLNNSLSSLLTVSIRPTSSSNCNILSLTSVLSWSNVRIY